MDGAELKALRLAAGLTRRELGQRAGITATAVSQFEGGIYLPNRRTARALRRALGLEPPAPTHAPDGARLIELADGRLTAVDADDFERLGRYRWRAVGSGYAQRQARDAAGKWRATLLHREVLGLTADDPRQVHHKNENPFDNRRSNLEVITQADHLRLHWRQRRTG